MILLMIFFTSLMDLSYDEFQFYLPQKPMWYVEDEP